MTRFRHETQPVREPVTSDSLRRLQLALEAQIVAAGAAGVSLFNGRSGSVSLSSEDVTTALGYTPASGGGAGHLPISIVDLPQADPNEPLLRWRLPTALTFTGGSADAQSGAAATSTLRIRKNGVDNGTVAFTGTTGTISFTSADYSAGDLFELYPPTTIDATLDLVSITFVTS